MTKPSSDVTNKIADSTQKALPLTCVDHKLSPVSFIPSPNFNERPADVCIDALVIHAISLPPNSFGGPYVEQLFLNELAIEDHPYFAQLAGLTVSSHVFIRRDGEIIQFVPFDKRAWHAGESMLDGRSNCNDFSIGIELEGCDDLPFITAQYESLAKVAGVLFESYPGLQWSRVVGHSDIAPGRKTDPGPLFDWEKFKNLFEAIN